MSKRIWFPSFIRNYDLIGIIRITLIMLTIHSALCAVQNHSRKGSLKNSPIYYIAAPLINRASHASVIGRPNYSNGFSQLYKLPIQYLSNAKPIDIITGISKTTTKKVGSSGFKKPLSISKLIYLPLTYLSNAKPVNVLINPFGKR